MSKDEALRLALEALEVLGWQPTEEAMDYRDNAIDAIKEVLAQPEHEPVAHVVIVGDMVSVSTGSNGLKELHKLGDGAPLYTTPPQRKPLTPAEVHDIWCYNHTPQEIVSAIEAAHGIKE